MAVELKDIKHWSQESGIGHILLNSGGGWVTTLCGNWGPGTVRKTRPKRLCKKCVACLAEVSAARKPAAEGEGK